MFRNLKIELHLLKHDQIIINNFKNFKNTANIIYLIHRIHQVSL